MQGGTVLVIGRREGQSIVLLDGRGQRRTVTLAGVVASTRFIHLYVVEAGNHLAVTLSKGNRLSLAATAGFAAATAIENNGLRSPDGKPEVKLAFDMPKEVQLYRAEILDRSDAKAVAL